LRQVVGLLRRSSAARRRVQASLERIIPAPEAIPATREPPVIANVLFSVAATSARNIWAAGTTDYASTLIVRWNGTAWK
jgi:hypothetical protein